jgi:hypothetical protein
MARDYHLFALLNQIKQLTKPVLRLESPKLTQWLTLLSKLD